MKGSTLRSAATLVGYYAILVAAFLGLERVAPAVRDTLSAARLRALSGAADLGRAAVDAAALEPPGVFVAILATLGALALAIPVAWVYRTTKPRGRLDIAVLQTVIVLPVAVAGIVLIVQNSLALAFSLAGIVAAVRFRNTLKDTKDAVYIFVAIGLGLAAGVQALGVGLVISLVYGLVMLAVTEIEPPPEPDTDRRPRVAGTLVVETGDDTGQKAVEGVLEEHARRWKLVRRAPAEGGRTTLAYAVRLRRKTTPAALVRDLRRAGPAVSGVEFETLEG